MTHSPSPHRRANTRSPTCLRHCRRSARARAGLHRLRPQQRRTGRRAIPQPAPRRGAIHRAGCGRAGRRSSRNPRPSLPACSPSRHRLRRARRRKRGSKCPQSRWRCIRGLRSKGRSVSPCEAPRGGICRCDKARRRGSPAAPRAVQAECPRHSRGSREASCRDRANWRKLECRG